MGAGHLVGGGFADAVQPRKLLAGSLVATGLSGLYLATIPSPTGLTCLFAFWGLSTIVPFWSALIRATREWGSDQEQGVAFGVLDGGRGLMAALLGTLALGLFVLCFESDSEISTQQQRVAGLRYVIITYMSACFVAAAAAMAFVRPTPGRSKDRSGLAFDHAALRECFAMPNVWLQAGIIAAAYAAFKGRDFYTQYAYDVYDWSEVETAGFSTLSTWVRPVAAIGAGLLADRWRSTRVIAICFWMNIAVYGVFLMTASRESTGGVLWANIMVSCVAIFALRGVYFAVMEESDVPNRLTGAAVGVISFVGFLPEIFVPLVGGALIEGFGGDPLGYQILFALMLLASLGGLGASLLLRSRLTRRPGADVEVNDHA